MENNDVYPCYVKIVATPESGDILEIPTESDGTILMTTLTAQFANCTGLRFKSDSGAWRGVRYTADCLHPPEDGWGLKEFVVTVANGSVAKRKSNDDDSEPKAKRKDPLVKDLVVLNILPEVTEKDLHKYFSKMGELALCDLQTHPNGISKGFAYIRFKERKDTKKTMSLNHNVGGKKVEIRLAEQKLDPNAGQPVKLFIGRIKQGTTEEELSEHFSPYGDLTDVFLPATFRGFGFVTFANEEEARTVLAAEHIINNQTVSVSIAVPKGARQQQQQQQQQQQRNFNNYGPGYGYGNNYNGPGNGYGNNYNNFGNYNNGGFNPNYSNFGPYGQ